MRAMHAWPRRVGLRRRGHERKKLCLGAPFCKLYRGPCEIVLEAVTTHHGKHRHGLVRRRHSLYGCMSVCLYVAGYSEYPYLTQEPVGRGYKNERGCWLISLLTLPKQPRASV